MKQRKVMLVLLAAVVSLPLLAAAVAAPAADGCSADARATLDEQEGSRLQFSVEVASMENCAHVEYDLVIEEQLPDGQENRIRKIREVKLDDGSLTEVVEYTLAEGHSLIGYEANVVHCRTCDLEP